MPTGWLPGPGGISLPLTDVRQLGCIKKRPAGIVSALSSQMRMKIGSQNGMWVSAVHMLLSLKEYFNVCFSASSPCTVYNIQWWSAA